MLFEHDGHDGEEEQLQEVVPAAVPLPAPPMAGRRCFLRHGWSSLPREPEHCDKTGQRLRSAGVDPIAPVGGQVTMGGMPVYAPHLFHYLSRRRCVAMMGLTAMFVARLVSRRLREATTSSRPPTAHSLRKKL